MGIVKVSLGDRSYKVLVGEGLLSKSGSIIKKLHIGDFAIIITNTSLKKAYGKKLKKSLDESGIDSSFELVPGSEKAKSSAVLLKLLDNISTHGKNKKIFIIALGGGVVGDISGFAAAIYKRGVPYIQIPTTLLAQVDSSIGGKTAIDLAAAKNLAGAFYQPKAVISDIGVLKSLSLRQVRNGLAEIIKYGVIKDRSLFAYLEKNYKKVLLLDKRALTHVITQSAKIKARLVEKDELDKKGVRMILNYGHTVGHAIEAAATYSNKYNHGEAIAIGMCVASDIACEGLKLLKKSDSKRIEKLIRSCGLPTTISGLKFNEIHEAHLHDKKFVGGTNRFVIPLKIGSASVAKSVPNQIVSLAIKKRLLN